MAEVLVVRGGSADGAGLGLNLDLSAVHEDEFVAAFSESASRVLVATTADRADQVLARAGELGIPATIVGETTETGALTLGGESVALLWFIGVYLLVLAFVPALMRCGAAGSMRTMMPRVTSPPALSASCTPTSTATSGCRRAP